MAKILKVKPAFKPQNFLGRGVTGPDSGATPKESQAMGYYYGRGKRNNMGRMRSDSIGYIPVSRKQLGTPPKSVV